MPNPFPDFARFTQIVRGREPFPWQAALAEEWLSAGRLPSMIDVPTGLGKTSVIDCWAYALARSSHAGDRRLPLRLFVVVDRRLIVDAAFEEGLKLKRLLDAARKNASDSLCPVSDALASISANGDPLECIRMRGGVTWESRWLARPDQPALVVGTVDQFGSRLLFRGYGTSARMRPLDAAMVGTDSWLVIDEAHIAAPLVATTGRVACLQRASSAGVGRPLEVTTMTATPEADADPDAFRIDPGSEMSSEEFPDAAAEARRRLKAPKPTALVELPPAGRRDSSRDRAERVGRMLAELAMRANREAELVGVLCNTIAAARGAHSFLVERGEEAALLIGRSREYERQRVLDEWLPRIGLGAEKDGMRRFVVATQTIEVGANLDLDCAVTEVAPLSSLIQRFGRVNRIGRRDSHLSLIGHCTDYHETDPVYGETSDETWRYLREFASSEPHEIETDTQLASTTFDGSHLDLGPLEARQLADQAPEAPSQEEGTPVLLPSDVERWAATNPAPAPEQAVAPFIRGSERSAPELSVAWRMPPPSSPDSREAWEAWLAIVPPVEWEFVSVPIWEVQGLLAGEPTGAATADVEGEAKELPKEPEGYPEGGLLGVAYTENQGDLTEIRGPGDIRVGSHLILRASLGGHDRWGWTGIRSADETVVPDVGDLAPTRRRGVLRLSPDVLASLQGAVTLAELTTTFSQIDVDDPNSAYEALGALRARLYPGELAKLLKRAQDEKWGLWSASAAAPDGKVAITVLTMQQPKGRCPALEGISDADEASTSQAGSPESLSDHLAAVSEVTTAFAEHLGLTTQLKRTLALAAAWHDLGKSEPRFQIMLHDGDELAAILSAEPRAKSGRDPADPIARRAGALAGVPRGFRHEAISVRIVEKALEQHPELADGVDHELILHLVASHHGCARPLYPPLIDEDAQPIRVTLPLEEPVEIELKGEQLQVDWTHPARFERLCARYGWWGLALLESIVRLADMLVSERGGSGVGASVLAETSGAAG